VWLLFLLYSGFAYCGEHNEWRSLPEYKKVLCSEGSWAFVAFDDTYCKGIAQKDPSEFSCFFARRLPTVVHYMELLVCKKSDYRIEITGGKSLFDAHKNGGGGSVSIDLSPTEALLSIYYENGGQTSGPVNVPHPSEMILSLKECNDVLCVFVGDQKFIEILPAYARLINAQIMHFTPMVRGEAGVLCSGVTGLVTRKKLPKISKILQHICPVAQSKLDRNNGWVSLSSVCLKPYIHSDFESEQSKQHMLKFSVASRRSVLSLYSSEKEEVSLYSECLAKVTLTAVQGALNTNNEPFALMNIKYGKLEQAADTLSQEVVYCTLKPVGDLIEGRLYAQSTNLLLGGFSFPKSELNACAELVFYSGYKLPYLVYPIAQNLSVKVCLGEFFSDGAFYIDYPNHINARITFFGHVGNNPWRQQFGSVPEINLSSPWSTKVADQVIPPLGCVQPLFCLRANQDIFSVLLFQAQTLLVEDDYVLCINAVAPPPGIRGGRHEVNVRLSAEDVKNHQLKWMVCQDQFLMMQVSPNSYLRLFFNKGGAELRVDLAAGMYAQDLCCFGLGDDEVVQWAPHTLPVRGQMGFVNSSVSYIAGEDGWGVCSSHTFGSDQAYWGRLTQLLRSNDRFMMVWAMQDELAQEKTVCAMCVEPDPDSSILFYYLYHTGEEILSCGAVSFDMTNNKLNVYKALAEQRDNVQDLRALTPGVVQKWPCHTILEGLGIGGMPKFANAPDGVRALFSNVLYKLYFSPVKKNLSDPSLKTLFAEVSLVHGEGQSDVLEAIIDSI